MVKSRPSCWHAVFFALHLAGVLLTSSSPSSALQAAPPSVTCYTRQLASHLGSNAAGNAVGNASEGVLQHRMAASALIRPFMTPVLSIVIYTDAQTQYCMS